MSDRPPERSDRGAEAPKAPNDSGDDAETSQKVDHPGLSRLREAVATQARRRLPGPPKLREDGLAGLNVALASVPDGMASGILAGVNPVFGLYACMAGPIAGGLVASTKLMVVATTSASALAAGQALAGVSGETREAALFAMVIAVGAWQILFGLLGLGRVTRFVSYSVMTGFVAGIGTLTILSQLPTVTGYEPIAGNKVVQTLDLVAHLGRVHLPSLGLALLALVLAVALSRTPLGNLASLVAVAVPSAIVALIGLQGVQIVRDVGDVPRGFPLPMLPSFPTAPLDVLTGSLAVAAIVLVQGAGVSQSVPNPDGSRRRMSRDFIAQGAANVASGFFRGLPVGGSLSTTALSVLSGARTRWAAILGGLWMIVVVVAFPGLVSTVAMPALGALLIVASASTIKPAEMRSLWETGWTSRLTSISTFLATLFLPIQAAVGLGVLLAAILYLNQSSTDVALVELVERPDGAIEERSAPKRLPSNRVTVLDVYGHLFFAGARTLERRLPAPEDASRPIVILRLRGRTSVGATLVDVLDSYADKLRAVGGRLYLAGISEELNEQLRGLGKLASNGQVLRYEATNVRGEATHEAQAHAQAWLDRRQEEGDGSDEEASADAPRDGAHGAE